MKTPALMALAALGLGMISPANALPVAAAPVAVSTPANSGTTEIRWHLGHGRHFGWFRGRHRGWRRHHRHER
jgi:hypothetical protein